MKTINLITILSLLILKLDSISSSKTTSKLSIDDELIKLFQTSILLIASNTSKSTSPSIKTTPPITTTPRKTTPITSPITTPTTTESTESTETTETTETADTADTTDSTDSTATSATSDTSNTSATSDTTDTTDTSSTSDTIDSTESDPSHQGPVPLSIKSTSKQLESGKSKAGTSKTKGKSLNSKGGNRTVPIYTMCSRSQSFALTFDDGPSEFSKGLDSTLKKHQSHATFFINGLNNGCIYDFADLLLARFKAGHLIGSHTWGHTHLAEGTSEQIHLQLELLEKAMIKILGVKPLWFRPPYGEYNDLVVQVLTERGYKGLVMWSDDSGDSFAEPPTSEKMIEAFNQYPPQSNILCHETKSTTTQEVMPTVVKDLSDKGLKLIPIAQCLDISDNPKDWYEYVGEPSKKDETWTCEGTPLPGSFV
ncbi:family 4 carbohydrate esterase [Melampsora larici-populina 98AG31]|uniref:Family 4 carbohydrate esterase n=1 Tax=Melampsora larici-populina (strain 98AG31 / pathotype 3-4-7) TaxID=747676 RepID=F4RX92_MELLP|nr:family 4 carbohydrate esterase [Melampsora larici-populina 98AG31]EGG03028.1 family 4 carbohydrate esterase [Melampsora larici-populina 98AG31]